MFASLSLRFAEILMTDCVYGERARYLVGANCPRLAFFYTVGLEALGGEFSNEKIKIYVNNFGTSVVFPRWEQAMGLRDMDAELLLEVEEALPPVGHFSHIFID